MESNSSSLNPAGLIQAKEAIIKGNYWDDKKEKDELIAGCRYFLYKAFGESLKRKLTLYALDSSTLRVAMSISQATKEQEKRPTSPQQLRN